MPTPRSAWEPVTVDVTGPSSSAPAWQAPETPPPHRPDPHPPARESTAPTADILRGRPRDPDGEWVGPPVPGRGRHAAPGRRGSVRVAAVVVLACAATALTTAAVVGRGWGSDRDGTGAATPLPAVERAVTLPAADDAPESDLPAPVTEPRGTAIADLVPGTCFLDPLVGNSIHDRVTTVSCDTVHDNEVVAVFALEGGPWPGTADVVAEAQRRCQVDGPAVVTAAGLEPSAWGFFIFHPTRAAWTAGDRSVQCVAYPLRGEPKTGALTN